MPIPRRKAIWTLLAVLVALAVLQPPQPVSALFGKKKPTKCSTAPNAAKPLKTTNVLPIEVTSPSDAELDPFRYFKTFKTIGEGAFGKVNLASLPGTKPGNDEPVLKPKNKKEKPKKKTEREFAVKFQYFDPKTVSYKTLKTLYAIRAEPYFLKLLNGLPYILHGWGSWTVPSTPMPQTGAEGRAGLTAEPPTTKLAGALVMPLAVSDLEKEIEGVEGKFYTRVDEDTPPIKEVDAKKLLAQLAIGIGHMHEYGVIHRDLKPGNILIDGKGRPMIADFGCAVASATLDEVWKKPEIGNCDIRLIAPEHTKAMLRKIDEDADEKTPAGYGKEVDWFDFGIIAFQVLTGTSYDAVRGDDVGPFNFPPSKAGKVYGGEGPLAPEDYLKMDLLDTMVGAGKISPAARSLVTALLAADPKTRLGGSGGYKEVLCHAFFSAVDAKKLLNEGISQSKDFNSKVIFSTRNKKPPPPQACSEGTAPADIDGSDEASGDDGAGAGAGAGTGAGASCALQSSTSPAVQPATQPKESAAYYNVVDESASISTRPPAKLPSSRASGKKAGGSKMASGGGKKKGGGYADLAFGKSKDGYSDPGEETSSTSSGYSQPGEED